MIDVEIANRQDCIRVDRQRLRRALELIVEESTWDRASLSVAIVGDDTIHALNRQYLDHDYATDVLSFVLEQDEEHLEGEIIASGETAQREAARFGWEPGNELLLYIVHGGLHLVGYDDLAEDQAAKMRSAEKRILQQFGLELPTQEVAASGKTEVSLSRSQPLRERGQSR